jgi:hypothetical protein
MSPSKERAGGTESTNQDEEIYAAFALYLIGMEVANADRDIDNAEFRMIFSTSERASEICHSGFVRRVTSLLAGAIDQKPRSRPLTKLIKTYDSSHEDVFWRVRRHLETLPQEDYMRYLLTGMLMAKQVSAVSSTTRASNQGAIRRGNTSYWTPRTPGGYEFRRSDCMEYDERVRNRR